MTATRSGPAPWAPPGVDRPALVVVTVVSLAALGAGTALLAGAGPDVPPVMRLPGLNAVLNATSAVLLVAGLVFVRRGRIAGHRACMLAAFAASILFLASYLVYHAQVGARPFHGHGAIRVLYLVILLTHTVLAAVVGPLALVTLSRALRARFDRHRRLARVTLPIWLYVSVTGVVVYVMLYRLGP